MAAKSIRQKLYEFLATYIDLVSGRVFMAEVDADPLTQAPPALPYIVGTAILSIPDFTHDGMSGLFQSYFKISCYGETYEQVYAVAEQVLTALVMWPETKEVQAAFPQIDQDLRDPDTGYYHIPVSFKIWHH